jgi:molybdopterin converting factor small subunit
MTMKITINAWAGLKDYFDGSFPVEFQKESSIDDLRTWLKNKTPESSSLLNNCRFAINQELVETHSAMCHGDVIDILPPSSGG